MPNWAPEVSRVALALGSAFETRELHAAPFRPVPHKTTTIDGTMFTVKRASRVFGYDVSHDDQQSGIIIIIIVVVICIIIIIIISIMIMY